MAATLAARAFEVRNEDIRDSLMSFNGVEHRLENTRIVKGVRFVNDSKATNINATWYALSSYDRPIVWIAGGRGDNNDYASLNDLVSANVKAIVCIGEEAEAIFSHWCTTKRCVKAASLEEAVKTSIDMAQADDVVLFSPACKSFDMFANFEERGRAFKQAVQQL
jgi:UDP-N-acetylmuramoylalanine--D-glutamate ligase